MPINAEQLLKLVDEFPWDTWAAEAGPDIDTAYRDLIVSQGTRTATALGTAFNLRDPFTQQQTTGYVGERIKQLGETTRDDVVRTIRAALEDGSAKTTKELSTLILDKVREKFDGYERWRADRIARTETSIGYNHGSLLGMHQAGITKVEVTDGDDDEHCNSVDGAIWTLTRALAEPIAHPNCTRAFGPVLDSEDANV